MICTPYLVYNQILLNLPRDDHNFSFSYGWSPFRLHKEKLLGFCDQCFFFFGKLS